MGLLDEITEGAKTAGMQTLGLLGSVGEAYLAAKAPAAFNALTKSRNRRRDQAEREEYNRGLFDMMQGTPEQNLMDDTFDNMGEAQAFQQMNPGMNAYKPATQGASEREVAQYMLNSSDPAARATGGQGILDSFDVEQDKYHYSKQGLEDGRTENIRINDRTGEVFPFGSPLPKKAPVVKIDTGNKTNPNWRDIAQITQAESNLRKDYDSKVSGFDAIRTSYQDIKNAPMDATGDMQVMYSIMKIFDPGAVVGTGDEKNIRETAMWYEQAKTWVDRLTGDSEVTMPPGVRRKFMRVAGEKYNRQLKDYNKNYKKYKRITESGQLNYLNTVGEPQDYKVWQSLKPEVVPPLPRGRGY